MGDLDAHGAIRVDEWSSANCYGLFAEPTPEFRDEPRFGMRRSYREYQRGQPGVSGLTTVPTAALADIGGLLHSLAPALVELLVEARPGALELSR